MDDGIKPSFQVAMSSLAPILRELRKKTSHVDENVNDGRERHGTLGEGHPLQKAEEGFPRETK